MSLYKLVFDPTDAASRAASANVGAYIRAGSDGELIDSTSNALHVFMTNSIGVAIDGVYDGGTNTDPDNVGLIAHVRAAAPADANQTFRSTGGAASSDDVVAANVHGLDSNSFGMVFDGTTWDRMRGTAGAVNIHDGGNSITVDGSVTVSATDLDIRDLTHVSDSVKIGDGTDFLAIAADGSIGVTDNGGSLTVDGTVAVSSVGGTVTVSDAALANTAGSNEANPIGTTSEALVASVLSNRKYLYTMNYGNKMVYLGFGTVTAANGFPMAPGAGYEFRAGASLAINAISEAGDQDIRNLQLS